MTTMEMWFFWFLKMVWRMRRHQEMYLRLKRQGDLYEAIKLERSVDEELTKHLVFEGGEPTALTGFEEGRS